MKKMIGLPSEVKELGVLDYQLTLSGTRSEA